MGVKRYPHCDRSECSERVGVGLFCDDPKCDKRIVITSHADSLCEYRTPAQLKLEGDEEKQKVVHAIMTCYLQGMECEITYGKTLLTLSTRTGRVKPVSQDHFEFYENIGLIKHLDAIPIAYSDTRLIVNVLYRKEL